MSDFHAARVLVWHEEASGDVVEAQNAARALDALGLTTAQAYHVGAITRAMSRLAALLRVAPTAITYEQAVEVERRGAEARIEAAAEAVADQWAALDGEADQVQANDPIEEDDNGR